VMGAMAIFQQLTYASVDNGAMLCEFRTKCRKSLDPLGIAIFLIGGITFDDEPVVPLKEERQFRETIRMSGYPVLLRITSFSVRTKTISRSNLSMLRRLPKK